MARISGKNQVRIPIAVLEVARLRQGDEVVVEAVDDGELRIRRRTPRHSAFGSLTGLYASDSLARLDAEDDER